MQAGLQVICQALHGLVVWQSASFQAPKLDLPTLSPGQVLTGHIVESKVGEYDPKNKIVRSAVFQVDKVLLNIPNPFFIEEEN